MLNDRPEHRAALQIHRRELVDEVRIRRRRLADEKRVQLRGQPARRFRMRRERGDEIDPVLHPARGGPCGNRTWPNRLRWRRIPSAAVGARSTGSRGRRIAPFLGRFRPAMVTEVTLQDGRRAEWLDLNGRISRCSIEIPPSCHSAIPVLIHVRSVRLQPDLRYVVSGLAGPW